MQTITMLKQQVGRKTQTFESVTHRQPVTRGQLHTHLLVFGVHRPEFSDISGTFTETPALNLKAN